MGKPQILADVELLKENVEDINDILDANNISINDINKESLLLNDNIRGTKSTVTLLVDGNVSNIQHRRTSDNIVVRTDVYDYSTSNMIIETRTLNTGETVILKYNLLTYEIEVI